MSRTSPTPRAGGEGFRTSRGRLFYTMCQACWMQQSIPGSSAIFDPGTRPLPTGSAQAAPTKSSMKRASRTYARAGGAAIFRASGAWSRCCSRRGARTSRPGCFWICSRGTARAGRRARGQVRQEARRTPREPSRQGHRFLYSGDNYQTTSQYLLAAGHQALDRSVKEDVAPAFRALALDWARRVCTI